jgi:hypothetical protein
LRARAILTRSPKAIRKGFFSSAPAATVAGALVLRGERPPGE